jgi:hypothetical protein
MCNPKPGVRCFNDTHKALTKGVDNFVKACETGDETKIERAAVSLNEDRVFYYATNYAKTNWLDARVKGKDALDSIPKEFKDRLDKEEEVRVVGRLLNSFQTVADKYRKVNNLSGLEAARKMYNGGCDKVLAHGKKDNQNKRDAKIGEILNETNSDLANAKTDTIEQETALRDRLLDKAHAYALADAKTVIDRDIKKNSKTVEYHGDPRTVTYKKNVDGTFTVTTQFDVKADNFAEAMDMAESTFGLEDMETTVAPIEGKPDYRSITSTYVYADSEKVEDAEGFQKFEVWKGSPIFRASLDDIARVKQASY